MIEEKEAEIQNDIDVSIIIPAYNEENTIQAVVSNIRAVLTTEQLHFEIIVVSDGSQDKTKDRAIGAGARVVEHPYNIGNGAAIKTGIRSANGKQLVFMDGDGQHDPKEIPCLLDKLETYDMVVGARTRRSETAFHRDFANRIYNLFASYVCNRKIIDLTSGYRAIRTSIAREFLHLLPNTFSYPTTLTLAVSRSGYTFSYHPIVVTKRQGRSKIKLVQDGLRFLVIIFKVTTLFSPLKIFIPSSLLLFLLRFGSPLF